MPRDASLRELLDFLAFSGLVAAAVAAALVVAAALGLGLPISPRLVALAFTGTLAVYDLDRLRDLERDRASAPLRSAFVERHEGLLRAWVVGSSLLAGLLSLGLPAVGWWLLALAFGLGVLHRRIKSRVWSRAKAAYVCAAWLAVVVGLPALAGGGPDRPSAERLIWVGGLIGAAILANLIASGLRSAPADQIACGLRSERAGLGVARALAGLGTALGALLAPASVAPLAAVPAAVLVSLLAFRPGERYGMWAVDGALLVGALFASSAL